ncbi:Adaptor for signal transduction [Aspergillus alliaceus]|uniref:Adaptor for signal transduction n=1 Tax=Petromyces alliaceus TaxID=209559 RepID=A0A8H6AFV4_PETAA|nr:Adaptor for signal transduction [Aspergillus burnettii]
MSLHTSYHADSDADDEYERSVITSPHLDSEASPSESDFPSSEQTPTTYANADEHPKSPRTIITEWTAEECAHFLAALGLRQYCPAFLENEIVGEALIALKHDELKEMGIASVGHRLTILKSVYETKVKQDIPLDTDHYIPLSADQSMNENASQEDVARLIQSIRLRDERIVTVETELRRMADDYRRLREELLPVFKMAKDRSQPLPPPTSMAGSAPDGYHDSQTLTSPSSGITLLDRSASIARTFSKRLHTGGTTPKNNSPTHIPPSIHEGRMYPESSVLDPSSAHYVNGKSQLSPGIPSPTSPGVHYAATQTLASRSYNQPTPNTSRSPYEHHDEPLSAQTRERLNPTPTQATRPDVPTRSDSRAGNDPPSVEIFKSFRVSMDDPCHKVLPAALKKYNINADWKQYALYIVYGDQERCLGLEERPLILFKQLEKEGRKPMFMLRKQLQHPVESGYPPHGGDYQDGEGRGDGPDGEHGECVEGHGEEEGVHATAGIAGKAGGEAANDHAGVEAGDGGGGDGRGEAEGVSDDGEEERGSVEKEDTYYACSEEGREDEVVEEGGVDYERCLFRGFWVRKATGMPVAWERRPKMRNVQAMPRLWLDDAVDGAELGAKPLDGQGVGHGVYEIGTKAVGESAGDEEAADVGYGPGAGDVADAVEQDANLAGPAGAYGAGETHGEDSQGTGKGDTERSSEGNGA